MVAVNFKSHHINWRSAACCLVLFSVRFILLACLDLVVHSEKHLVGLDRDRVLFCQKLSQRPRRHLDVRLSRAKDLYIVHIKDGKVRKLASLYRAVSMLSDLVQR